MAQSKNIKCIELVTNKSQDFNRVLLWAQDFEQYFYIVHDKDVNKKTGEVIAPHVHCLVYMKNGTTQNGWFARVGDLVPKNFVEFINNKRASIMYLTHETAQAQADGKHVYDRSELKTNVPDYYASLWSSSVSAIDMYRDFASLRCAKMTPEEFIEKYQGQLSSCGFYQKLRVFSTITENYGRLVSGL